MLISNAAAEEWPDLPETGFTSGRAASIDDVAAGNAVFSMQGKGLGPIQMDIPQYVLWEDEHGEKHPMILVQAEEAPDGTRIVGLRAFDGTNAVATLDELTLLGKIKPAT